MCSNWVWRSIPGNIQTRLTFFYCLLQGHISIWHTILKTIFFLLLITCFVVRAPLRLSQINTTTRIFDCLSVIIFKDNAILLQIYAIHKLWQLRIEILQIKTQLIIKIIFTVGGLFCSNSLSIKNTGKKDWCKLLDVHWISILKISRVSDAAIHTA